MNDMMWGIAVIIVLAVIGAAVYVVERQRSRHLQTQFGPEYDRVLQGVGHRRAAERALVERTERVDKLQIRSLSRARRDELHDRWQDVQAQFVDDPATASREAHALLTEVMRERGYPTTKYEDEVELLSVHHPAAVQHYRAAHQLAAERARGAAATEDLRQAMIHYRALFDDLLDLRATREPQHKETRREA
jgi:hypothetical protein